jgi:hypothetical protein
MGPRTLLLVGVAVAALLALLWRSPSSSGPGEVVSTAFAADARAEPSPYRVVDQLDPLAAAAPIEVLLGSDALLSTDRELAHVPAGRIRLRLVGVSLERLEAARYGEVVSLLFSREMIGSVDRSVTWKGPSKVENGALEFEDLEEGDYIVSCRLGRNFRCEPTRIRLGVGERLDVDLPVKVLSRFAFQMEAIGDLSPGPSGSRWSVRALQYPDQRLQSPRVAGMESARNTRSLDLELRLYPGTVRFEATVKPESKCPVVPPARAVVELTLPEAPEGGLYQAKECINAEPLCVELDFGGPHELVTFHGRIGNDPDVRGRRMQLEGTSTDNVDFSEKVIVLKDGNFAFSVDLARLAGPQVTFTSRKYTDQIGPVSLSGGNVDLGTFTFVDPAVAAPATTDTDGLK